jgi:cytoskeletal protein CcmA (bactofilin family)
VATTKPIVKVNVQCPHCGFEQLEPQAAKSTICKNCSSHFEINSRVSAKPSQPGGGFLTQLAPKPKQAQPADLSRTVACFDCSATHRVSSLAKTTLCPSCGSYIDLQDFNITGLFSRSIRTRGRLVIAGRGDLNCGRAICGSAVIEGRIRGSLNCEGKAVFKSKGKLSGDIEANHLVIERAAEVEFSRPVRAGRVEIMGKVTGKIICGTEIYIYKKGSLMGSVHAKSFVVDHGGYFIGDVDINPVSQLEYSSGRNRDAKRTSDPAGQVAGDFSFSH